MTINSIKTAKVFAGPGKYAYVAEAEMERDGKILYATIQEHNGEDCTVSKDSMFAFIAEDGADPAEEFIAEYKSADEAKAGEYGAAFCAALAVMDILKLGDIKHGVA